MAAAANSHSGGSSNPAKASGVTTSVTHGMASRLATKPTSEICWKMTSVSGASPSVASACARSRPLDAWQAWRHSPTAAARTRGQAPCGGSAGSGIRSGPPSAAASSGRCGRAALPEAINSPTATKDSQKPGCSSAQGSRAVTTAAAASSTSGAGQRRPAWASAAAVASIHTVRWAGTPQPANAA